MTDTNPAKIGLIGLGVMGQNLALNIERNHYPIAVFNREPTAAAAFASRHPDRPIIPTTSPEEFVRSLERPRKIILLVKAGDPVDWTINLIKPFLEKGDIIIDGGNSYIKDTERRERELKTEGLYMIGSGTSGGEKGALWGPSLMPGGDRQAYEEIRPIWEAIAAKVEDGPCVTYIGPGGSGHYVKMVHNGIEYGDMQLIAEAYDLLRKILRLDATQMAQIFEQWNQGELESYLIEITAKILRVRDSETDKPLVDLVGDKAGQKGTGKWTSQVAQDLGIAIPTIEAALTARNISARKEERVVASKLIGAPSEEVSTGDQRDLIEAVREALYASKICSYAQGMSLIRAGSDEWNWGINMREMARIWKGGCIIRARFLDSIMRAYERDPQLRNLLLDDEFNSRVEESQESWRRAVAYAQANGIAVPSMSASLAYFDSYRSETVPHNLTQAQRDYFGAHTYQRNDKGADAPFVHTDWIRK